MDLTGLSDANAYNWNGFTAGLQVSMSSSGGGESSLARSSRKIKIRAGKKKNNGLTLQVLLVVYCNTQMLNGTGLFTYILAFVLGGKCR